MPDIDFMNNIFKNDEAKDIKIISRKTVRHESKDYSSFEKSSNSRKSGKHI